MIRYWPNMVAVLVLLVIGFNLYTFRGYRRLWFGILEIVVASALGWYAINKATVGGVLMTPLSFLIAALYLMGRVWINISSEFDLLQIRSTSRRD